MRAGSETVGRTCGGDRRALPVDPHELMILDRARAVEKKAVLGHGNAGLAPPAVPDRRSYHFRVASQFHCLLVDRLCHQRMVVDEQQASGTSAEYRGIQR